MNIHFIAIGGSAMHNMALAMHNKGYKVTGSDDEINEPSKSRLLNAGILPTEIGWFPDKITKDTDAVILGMHAREDNPELIKARELGLKIYSYPEYIYEQTKDKTRIVIGGSHGKTTITSMILHVFKNLNINADFMVGAQLEGFDTMVKLTKEAKFAVIEGDEYLASPIDRRPKFHLYHPNIAIISGIAWDHINVFPTFEIYVEQFRKFISLIETGGKLFYCENDEVLNQLAIENINNSIQQVGYGIPEHIIENGTTSITNEGKVIPLKIFGNHNLMNLNGARLICNAIGISNQDFYKAISDFKGAAKRLESVRIENDFAMYKDFAHSPSKLKATVSAMKQQFASRELIACMELHTFSSLTEEFLNEYKGAMNEADKAIVYFNPHTIEHKKLKPITEEQVKNAFGRQDIITFTQSNLLVNFLTSIQWNNKNLLMMSSGNFDGIDFKKLSGALVVA
jgi:UDP-N-acetylmuramate: L-alanyl-gamma-D-glutamyl-meso-diaminopimelate ligase